MGVDVDFDGITAAENSGQLFALVFFALVDMRFTAAGASSLAAGGTDKRSRFRCNPRSKMRRLVDLELHPAVSLRDEIRFSSDCKGVTTSLDFSVQGQAASCKGRISPLGRRNL